MPKDKYQFDIVLNTLSKNTGSKNVEKSLNQISRNADKTNKELSKISVTVSGSKLTRPFQRMNNSLRQINRNTKDIRRSLKGMTSELSKVNASLSNLHINSLTKLDQAEKSATTDTNRLNTQMQRLNSQLGSNRGKKYFDDMDRSIRRSTRSAQKLYYESERVGRGRGSRYRQGMLRTTAPYAMTNPMLGLFGFFGLNSMKEIAFDTGVRNETNQILLKNIGGDYDIFDKVTNESLTSIQDLIPAMNAVKAADNLTAEQVNAHAGDLAQFGAYAKILSGSQDRANEAMMRLGKAFNGQYMGVDQYGITADSLRHVGYEPNNPDFDKFMAAVRKIMGSNMDEIMQTTQGQIALTYKSFTKAGKEIGAAIMPIVKQTLHLFNSLNNILHGIPAKLLIVMGGVLSLAAIFTNTYNEVMAVIDTFSDMKDRFRRIIGEEEGPAFGNKFNNRGVIDAINEDKGVSTATESAKQSVRSFTESVRNFAQRVKWEAQQLLHYPEETLKRWGDYFTKPQSTDTTVPPEAIGRPKELPGPSVLNHGINPTPIESEPPLMLEEGKPFHKSYKTFETPDRAVYSTEKQPELKQKISTQGQWNQKEYVSQNDWSEVKARLKTEQNKILQEQVRESAKTGFASTVYPHPLSFTDKLRLDQLQKDYDWGAFDSEGYEQQFFENNSPYYPAQRTAVNKKENTAIKQKQKLGKQEKELEKQERKRTKTINKLDVETKRINRSRSLELKQMERQINAKKKSTATNVQQTLTFNALNESYQNVNNSTSKYNSQLNSTIPTTVKYGQSVNQDETWLNNLNRTTATGTGVLNTFNTSLERNTLQMEEDALSAENLARAMQQLTLAEARYNVLPTRPYNTQVNSTARSIPWYALPRSEIPYENQKQGSTKRRTVEADEIITPDGSRFNPNSAKEKARNKVPPNFQNIFDDKIDDSKEFIFRDWSSQAKEKWEDSSLYGRYNYAKYKVGNKVEQSQTWQDFKNDPKWEDIKNSEFAEDARGAYNTAKEKYRPRMGQGSTWKEKIAGADLGGVGYAGMFGGQLLGMAGGAMGGDFGNLMAQMGNTITLISGFAQIIGMIKNSEVIMGVLKAVFDVVKGIIPLISKIVPVLESLGSLIGGFLIANPEILAVVLAIVAAVAVLWHYWENITSTVQRFVNFIKDVLVTVFVEPLIPLFEALDDVWNAITGLFGGEGGDLLVDIGNTILEILQPVGQVIMFVAKALGLLIKEGIQPFVFALRGIANIIKGIGEGFAAVKEKVMGVLQPIFDFFDMIGEKIEWLTSLVGIQPDTNPETDYNRDGEPDKDGALSQWAKGLVEQRDHPQPEPTKEETDENKPTDLSSLEGLNLESTADLSSTDVSVDTGELSVDTLDTQTTTPTDTNDTTQEVPKTIEPTIDQINSANNMNINAETVQLNAQHIEGWNVKDQQKMVDEIIVQQNQAALNQLKTTAQREHTLAQQLRDKHNRLFGIGPQKEKENVFSIVAELPLKDLSDKKRMSFMDMVPEQLQKMMNTPFIPVEGTIPERMHDLFEKTILPPFLENKIPPMPPGTTDKHVAPPDNQDTAITNYITVNVDNVSDESHIKNMVDELTKVLTWDNIRAGRTIGLGDKT